MREPERFVENFKKMPIGLSTLSMMLDNNCLYVDKTREVHRLITSGFRYFLSRPRRFGKSLLVSTLTEIFAGNKELFKDLWIGSSNYRWEKHGIIKLDFTQLNHFSPENLSKTLCTLLKAIGDDYQISFSPEDKLPEELLKRLVRGLRDKFGKVALLVDEYDSPILKTIHDQELGLKVCKIMQSFFASIKSYDDQVDFVFITGVSNFAKAGVFSGMNNLKIISLDDNYGTICGYTNEEIDQYFSPYLQRWANTKNKSATELRENLKRWYNGYKFGGDCPKVYNPFSILNAVDSHSFDNYWIQSGTPTFLVEKLKEYYQTGKTFLLEESNMSVTRDSFAAFEVSNIPLESLMVQAGYLTIKEYEPEYESYLVQFPNHEVAQSCKSLILNVLTGNTVVTSSQTSISIRRALDNKNMDELVRVFQTLFARVTYFEHIPEERYYHSLVQMAFDVAGILVSSQVLTSLGRIDLVLSPKNYIYVVELKYNKPASEAMKQIKEKKYYQSFLDRGKPVVLLGLSFCKNADGLKISSVSEEVPAS